ncbi:MAG: hypothetical protein QOE90_2809 [Thermoplasmata archaeon]|jgi:hypothetical protein|nr:hypothetical protein [Thermoplasmata archaeon]
MLPRATFGILLLVALALPLASADDIIRDYFVIPGVGAVPVPGVEAPASCTATPGADCWVRCAPGQAVSLTAQGPVPGYVVGSFYCGGSSASCTTYTGSCSAQSTDPAFYADSGWCTVQYDYATTSLTCSVGAFASVGAGPTQTGPVGGEPVGTPNLDKTCAPEGLVCVGPVPSIPLGTLPPVDPIPLTPGVLVGIAVSPSAPSPQTGSTIIGPIVVPESIVPVDLCDSTCSVPTASVEGGPLLIVEYQVGSEGGSIPVQA